MIYPPDHILVLGHRNPDTDASTSAFGYAAFLQKTEAYREPVVSCIPGPPPPQTQYVFDRVGVPPPPIVESLLPRVSDVAQRAVDSINVETRFRDAVELLIRTEHSMLPVLDDDGGLVSVFSHRRDVSRFLFNFDVIPILSRLLNWNDIREMDGARLVGPPPRAPDLNGRVLLAVAGEESWRSALERDDLLVCGDLAVVRGLAPERRPSWLVLTSQEVDLAPQEVGDLTSQGMSIVQYRHCALDFLFALLSQVRVGALAFETGACVGEFDFLHDIQGVVKESRHALPVLNGEGRLVGTIARKDLRAPPRRRIILMDHFESSQATQGFENAEILEIVDHHRVGDIQTLSPVRIDCRPVGSSSTIVALRHIEAEVDIDRPIAMLLLGGLLSDTLGLRSPTTTPTDRRVVHHLAEIAGVEPDAFAREILRAGDDLVTADPARIWNRDQKSFGIRNRTFTVAQLETVVLEQLDDSVFAAFERELRADFERGSHLLSALFLTDVLKGSSWVTVCESPVAAGVLARCFGAVEPRKGWILAEGVVSRKKQIVPALMRVLSECRL